MIRILLLTIFCGCLEAQQPAPAQTEGTLPKLSITVQNVVAPVWVYDEKGNYVNGLRADQFHLYDNGREQNARLDEAFEPISMVILLQANAAVEHMLPMVSKIGNLIGPLIIGDRGEAA